MAVFTESERVEVWDRRQAGESNRSIGRRLGRSAGSIRAFVEASGGVRPAVRRRSVRHLSLVEREEISRGVAAGRSLRIRSDPFTAMPFRCQLPCFAWSETCSRNPPAGRCRLREPM